MEKDVIAGHVVPGSMLFTLPTLNNEMKTATYDNRGGLKVTAVVEPGNPQEETERGKGKLARLILSTFPQIRSKEICTSNRNQIRHTRNFYWSFLAFLLYNIGLDKNTFQMFLIKTRLFSPNGHIRVLTGA